MEEINYSHTLYIKSAVPNLIVDYPYLQNLKKDERKSVINYKV